MEVWNDHKSLLNHVFFTDDDVIRKNTKEQKDFWTFLEKYEKFKSRKSSINEPSKLKEEDNKYDFPTTFNKRYKINIAISSTHLKNRYKEYVSRRYDSKRDCKLSFEDALEFKQILLFYLDFLQKQKFAKLAKLKEDQNNLPIKQYEQNIVYAVKTNQVVIVAGDTGCGKSTQVPQYLLKAGFTQIACTQPRRIACISLAKRVSYETLNEYQSEIAYQVRFETSKSRSTKILFLTEGLLLRQFQSDPDLSMYDVIVVDEVHERHINGDFLLGVLKCLLQKRDDLKLVLMSATINIDLFTNYFDSAPVIQVPGRLYPIELQYVPHFIDAKEKSSKAERLDPSPYLRVLQLIDKKYDASERGDLLIFMSGMSEISSVVDAAKEYALRTKSWIVLPLHSTLSIEEQEKIFDFPPEGIRKCIVSTNIAETSVTIDGVRFIADSGKVKEMTYDAQVKMQRLQEFWISQASAEQRKGRAGRTGPGVCFRLYSEEDYGAFDPYSTPEIHRVPLDSLVLQMAGLGLRDPTLFPFIEPPQKSNLVNAVYFLKEQNALTKDGELTATGNMLSKLPVDIGIGKMLIMGCLFSIVEPVLVIAAALSVQSPMTRKFGVVDDTEHRRKEFFSPHGDPFTLLNIYDEWILVKSDRSINSKKWCKRRGFEEQRFYEISKLRKQFEGILRDHNLLKESTERRTVEDRVERKRLINLKREHKTSGLRKKKMLKLDSQYGDGVSDDSDHDDDVTGTGSNSNVDLNDIEFKLRHNLMKLEATSKQNRRFTLRDVNLLKLIISSGLYPQIVLPDESNAWRKSTEQIYHSKDKQFLMLHPTSIYSLQPEFLDSFYRSGNGGKEDSGAGTGGSKSKQSDRGLVTREFLVYVSLLETNKPYVVNSMKVPILQTLFLLSNTIDTNTDFSKVVFNEWIELCFDRDTEEEEEEEEQRQRKKKRNRVEQLISDVVQLRKSWDTLLEQKLYLQDCVQSADRVSKLRQIERLEEDISYQLAAFISTEINYTIRRLSSVEVKSTYVGHVEETPSNVTEIDGEMTKKQNTFKGGVYMTPYLTYGCLKDDLSVSVSAGEAEFLVQHYHCPKCEAHLICTVVERIQHDEECSVNANLELMKKHDATTASSSTDATTDTKPPNTKKYFCEQCNEELDLTPIEILKHKKSHS